jgi:preprotein translocase subunit SecE
VQAAQLPDKQGKEKQSRPAGDEEILPFLPETHASQRNEVTEGGLSMAKENAAESKKAPQTSSTARKNSDSKAKKPEQKSKDKENLLKKVSRFFRELRSEFKKIVWPTKKQVIQDTLTVVAVVLVMGVAVWLLDLLFISGFQLVFNGLAG